MKWLVALVAVVVGIASCVLLQDTGTTCTTTADCTQPLDTHQPREECVFVDHAGECVPVVAHFRTTCTKTSDCDAALFPVEANCETGECRCDVVDNCSDTGAVVDHVHCACSHGNEHEFCNSGADCQLGLNCTDSKCSRGTKPGDVCDATFACAAPNIECVCDGSADNCTSTVGNCFAAAGVSCAKSTDCIDGHCVDAKCSTTCGDGGRECTTNDDCCSGQCEDPGSGVKACFG